MFQRNKKTNRKPQTRLSRCILEHPREKNWANCRIIWSQFKDVSIAKIHDSIKTQIKLQCGTSMWHWWMHKKHNRLLHEKTMRDQTVQRKDQLNQGSEAWSVLSFSLRSSWTSQFNKVLVSSINNKNTEETVLSNFGEIFQRNANDNERCQDSWTS